MPGWEEAKIVMVVSGAITAPIIAIELDIARYKRSVWFHPGDRFSGVIILMGLLFGLGYFARPWLLPFPWSGLILPVAAIVWHIYANKRLRRGR